MTFQKKLILENFNYSHYLKLIDFCKTKTNDVPNKIGILLLNLKNPQTSDQNSLKLKVRERPRWTPIALLSHFNAEHASSCYLISMGSAKSIIFDIPDSLIFCTRLRIVPSATNRTLAISLYMATSHVFAAFTRFFCSNLHAVSRAPNFRNYN